MSDLPKRAKEYQTVLVQGRPVPIKAGETPEQAYERSEKENIRAMEDWAAGRRPAKPDAVTWDWLVRLGLRPYQWVAIAAAAIVMFAGVLPLVVMIYSRMPLYDYRWLGKWSLPLVLGTSVAAILAVVACWPEKRRR